MAYTINKSDGTILANVADGQVDTLSSDITLIGKNYSGFGEALNENFVKLLENFASSTRPTRPVRGQIWFDTTEGKLKVYSGTGFVPVSSATISTSQPATLGVGDLWFNDVDKQLYFYDGSNVILLGPSYSQSQGRSGLEVSTILDQANTSRVVTSLYNNGTLLGIFSKDQFIPKIPIAGFNTGSADRIIYPGFNAGTLTGIKFDVTSSNAEKLDNILASNFARRDQSNILFGQVSISTNDGIVIGDGSQASLQVDVGNVILSNTAANRRLELKVRKDVDSESAINILSSSREIKVYEGFTDSTVSMGGNLVVEGNLTVNGTTTTVNTEVMTVEDKNIELASAEIPSEENADGGGIILKGGIDHNFLWTEASQAWNSTEHINLESGKAFKINGVAVLTSTSLGTGITSIPGVNQFGTLKVVDIGPSGDAPDAPDAGVYIRILDNRISTHQTDQDLEIAPDGAGNVSLIGTPKIVGLSTTSESFPSQSGESPSLLSATELSEATTKKYVTNFVRKRTLVFSMDISDAISNTGIATILMTLAPPVDYENGTLARILCTSLSNSTTTLNINTLISKNNSVEYSTPTGTGFPLQDVAIANATVSAPSISVYRVIKTFEIIAGSWSFVS
jgi:hypothetical protein